MITDVYYLYRVYFGGWAKCMKITPVKSLSSSGVVKVVITYLMQPGGLERKYVAAEFVLERQ